jgi:hypothetical protein
MATRGTEIRPRRRVGGEVKTPKPSIADKWNQFAQLVFRPGTSEIQIRDMRRAYYIGFHTALLTLLHGVSEGDEPTDSDVAYLSQLHEECERFAADIKRGRA